MEYTFTLTEAEANIVISALAELPAKTSMSLIGKLQKQFSDQAKKETEEIPTV